MSTLSFEPFGRSTWRDPYPLYARLREEDPVHCNADGLWVLSRFSHVWDAARDTATFSSAQGLSFRNDVEELGLAPTMVMMDPPDHTRYRRLVNRGFAPRQVGELEPALREFVRDRIDRLRAAGTGDFVSSVAAPTANWVVATYLGVPEGDRDLFGQWTELIVQAGAGGHLEGTIDAVGELYAYFTELVDRRRREPGDDLVSDLLRADDDGAGVGLEGILGYAFVMIAGGNDTVIGLLGGATELLTAHPDQRQRLLEDRALLPGALEEMLRLTSPVQGLCRVTRRDVDVDGRSIPSGDRVLLLYGSANRDPREFGDDADSFDVGRSFRRQLTFSMGPHVCIGKAAARLEGKLVLEALLDGCPGFVVDAEAGTFAEGAFTRRYDSLPFAPAGL